ncbi:MAG: hypothetical protein IT449_15805 [Phycisphaerales bacterium]|nr:hypothetical protein [Phycisphaerales bacterium]
MSQTDSGIAQRRGGSPWPMRLLVGFLALTCVRVWTGPMLGAAPAQAQTAPPPFDATAQRKESADELRKMNATLEAILDTLKRGTLNVKMQESTSGGAAPAAKKK